MLRAPLLAAVLIAPLALGCGDENVSAPADGTGPRPIGCDPGAPPTRTASCVVSFSPGAGAGWGQDAFPEVVYGEPKGAGAKGGNKDDVLSLGKAGEIVLGFGGNAIVDGDGIDFIVFENPFYLGNPPNEKKVFAEVGEVAVSEDGVTWTPFPCKPAGYPYEGCAGWKAVFANPETGISAFDPEVAGGDQFDLHDIGVAEARFVRIWDLSNKDAPEGKAGFDLDAVSIVHPAVP